MLNRLYVEIWAWKETSNADTQQFCDPNIYFHRRRAVASQSQIKGKKSYFLKFNGTMNFFPVQSLLIAENNFPALFLTFL